MNFRYVFVTVLSWLVLGCVNVGRAETPSTAALPTVILPTVITHHVGRFGGERVAYTATVEGLDVITGAKDEGVRLVSFAYTCDGADRAPRLPPDRCQRVIDTQTTTGAAELLATRSGWDPARVTLRYYNGGQMGYSVAATKRAIGDDIRALVRGRPEREK